MPLLASFRAADASAVVQAVPQSRFARAFAELGVDPAVDPGTEVREVTA